MSVLKSKKTTTLAAGLAVGAAFAVPLAAGLSTPAYAHPGHSHEAVTIRLDPLKGSNASGTAVLTPTADGGLKVQINDHGMTPGMPHAQHIHGDLSGKHFTCPGPDADSNNNGYISVEEGLPMYGGIHISLTTKGDTSPKSGLAVDRMPVADAQGNLRYTRTLTAAELPAGTLEHLSMLHIVQHGVDANGNDKYDMDGLGESSFAKSLGVSGIPEEATDGATCGMPVPTGVNTGGEAGVGVEHQGLLAFGGLLLAGAGTTVALGRRASRSANRQS
ncbi:hypothetical protein [Aestuariimicrobium kwangyangense]|uniref:hypothetical protein n=1 Tax=Aestuariimicrobium kwangyangense TaxID=396389 RepID=UPI0003B49378|nr:hypothetical protein [Aestuariimicrobium kwangyangense]